MGGRVLVDVIAAAVVSGELVAAGHAVPSGLAGLATGGAAAVCALLALCSPHRRSAYAVLTAGLVATLAGGLLVRREAAVPADPDHVARLPLPLATRLVGRVAAPSAVSGGRTVVELEAGEVTSGGERRRVRGRVRVRVRGAIRLARGEIIAVDTTLRRARNFANPGGFDAAGALARRGIHVIASVWDPATIARVGAGPGGVEGVLDRWRDAVRAVVDEAVAPTVAPVLLALVLGDEGDIPPDVRATFTRAGVVHVLSVSGLHVGIAMTASAGLLVWLLGRHEELLLRFDCRKLAMAGGLAVAVLYGALTGLAVATARALVMAAVVVAAVGLERAVEPMRAIAVAALLVAVVRPGAPSEISYQLSFVSVAALVLGAGRQPANASGPAGWLRRGARAAGVAWAWTVPLTAFHFHQVSLVSVAANPVVVPLFEGVSILPALAGALLAPVLPEAARFAFVAASVPVRVALAVVRIVGSWGWAAVDVPLPSVPELLLVYGVLAGLWMRRHRAGRVLLGVAALALAADAWWWFNARWTRPGLRVTALDVGQGDATVVELPGGRVLVVDAGGFAGSDFDTGAAIVEPFLRARKIQTVDALVMSHAHPDHAGGLAHLVRHLAPGELWWSGVGGTGQAWEETVRALRETGTPARVLRAGDVIADFPEVEVLHPPRSWTVPSLNEGSLVLRVRAAGAAVLLAGDAERAAEAAMLAGGAALGASLLKVPHHGSRTSSGVAFVAAVDPVVAIVSSGAGNRFGHPAPEVLRRYAAAGVDVWRTDECGAVAVELGGGPARIEAYRPCRGTPAVRKPPPP